MIATGSRLEQPFKASKKIHKNYRRIPICKKQDIFSPSMNKNYHYSLYAFSGSFSCFLKAQLGISIKADATGICIPASGLTVRFRSIPVSEHSDTGAFRYWTGSPYSGTGLVPVSALLFVPVPN